MDAVATCRAPLPAPTNMESRTAWVVEMRRRFSPPDAVNPDGSIRQEFFRPQTVITLPDRKWGDAQRDLLCKGLAQYGVAHWREISEAFLPGWDDQALRLKAARLLCCQNLSRYVGRRFTAAEAAAEADRNRAIGLETGCWKNGMLVDDARGTLKRYFAAAQDQQQIREQQQQQQQQQQHDGQQQQVQEMQQPTSPLQPQPQPPPAGAGLCNRPRACLHGLTMGMTQRPG